MIRENSLKKMILFFFGTYLVMVAGFRLLDAGHVRENAMLVLDESACLSVGPKFAPVIRHDSCDVTANVSATLFKNNYLLEFDDGSTAEVNRDSVRMMGFSTMSEHYKPWHSITTIAGWALLIGWVLWVMWSAIGDISVLSQRWKALNKEQ